MSFPKVKGIFISLAYTCSGGEEDYGAVWLQVSRMKKNEWNNSNLNS